MVYSFKGFTPVVDPSSFIHGAMIGRDVLVGMNAVIMDNAEIGAGSIIGALSFVKANEKIPKRSLVVGNPAKIIKKVSDEMLAWKKKGTELYQTLPKDCQESLQETEPLAQIPMDRPSQESLYSTWNDIKSK